MMRNLIKNILKEDDFDWVRDVRMSLQPDSVYYFLPPLNYAEMCDLEGRIEDNDQIGLCKNYGTRTGDGNNNLLMLSTGENGVVDAWQNSVDPGDEHHPEGIYTLDHIIELMDDHLSKELFYNYVDGRKFFFNKNINESDDLSWMDEVPYQQKIFIRLTEPDEADYLLSILQLDGGYTYVSRSARYRGDNLKKPVVAFLDVDASLVNGVIVNVYTKKIHRIIFNSDVGIGITYSNSGIPHTVNYINSIPQISHRDFIDTYIDNTIDA